MYKWVNSPQFAKIRVFKVDNFVLPIFLATKMRSVAQVEWKKHPFFSAYGSKKSEINEKIPNPKSCRQLP